MTTLSAEVAEAVRLRDAATPSPWTTDVVVAATGLEHTSYAHQVKIGIHSYNVAFRNCQNWTSIIYGHESQRGEGKLEHDVSIHPDAALIAAAPSHVDLIQRLHARVRELEIDKVFAASVKKHRDKLIDDLVQEKLETERLRVELAQARAEFIAVVDAEPELPGDMPDAMWLSIRDDRDAATEAMRIVVRQTKRGIKARLSERP